MARLSPRSTRQLEQLLQAHGFRYDGREGPHDVWIRSSDGRGVALPRNRRSGQVSVGTVMGILRRAGISREEALRFWGIE
jgi:predicted RNA binding protein YcfA (HicA-like mRNA interferase family)